MDLSYDRPRPAVDRFDSGRVEARTTGPDSNRCRLFREQDYIGHSVMPDRLRRQLWRPINGRFRFSAEQGVWFRLVAIRVENEDRSEHAGRSIGAAAGLPQPH
jgi:hypothetical protein